MNTIFASLRRFVEDEQQCAQQQILEIWGRKLGGKLQDGYTQSILRVELTQDSCVVRAVLGDGESRYREGDMVCIHLGDPIEARFFTQLSLERDDGDAWLLRGRDVPREFAGFPGGACYAEVDNLDLSEFYKQALDDIASKPIGRDLLIPLLEGSIAADGIYEGDYDLAAERAELEGFNPQQVEAAAIAVGARHLSCIQGPPGTGKTRVLALVAGLLVERGEKVFLSSHTHMAINNALNQVVRRGVPVVKIGSKTSRRTLDKRVPCCEKFADWRERPLTGGFAVGATPFATCTSRMQDNTFDTLIFDEASQVTLALALMAMRCARKYIFIGDHKQLPPVILSRSILDGPEHSVFTRMLQRAKETSVTLTTTYRMNAELTEWPSRTFYNGCLTAAPENARRCLCTPKTVSRHAETLSQEHSRVFIASSDGRSRVVNPVDARLVVSLCQTLLAAGVPPGDIGIIAPFRLQGRRVRTLLAQKTGHATARQIVADTVERMQGQEREVIIYTLAATDKVFLTRLASFLFQPQRLNVAVTRARRKLIVIGPDVPLGLHLSCPITAQWVQWYEQLVACCRRLKATEV